MKELQVGPERLLNVRFRLGHEYLLAQSPSLVQVLLEIRPNVRTRQPTQPVDVRLVIDVSSSMGDPGDDRGDSKLTLVKRGVLELLEELGSRDRVLVSVFSTQGRLLVPSTRLNERGAREKIEAAIAGLLPQETTNISAGLELALRDSPTLALTRVFLFTDGESSDSLTDHAALVELADRARCLDFPLFIYGTGSSYNWPLLQLLAIRAGGGSFCKHVLGVEELTSHMLSELACLRGTAVDHLTVTGVVADGAKITSVHSTLPVIRKLDIDHGKRFQDHTGALDILRAAILLAEVEVACPTVGTQEVLTLTISGRRLSTCEPFQVSLPPVVVTFVEDGNTPSPVDEEVHRVMLMVAGAKKADTGDFAGAEGFYRRAGDHKTADSMATMHGRSMADGADKEALRRAGSSLTGESVSMSSMGVPGDLTRRRKR